MLCVMESFRLPGLAWLTDWQGRQSKLRSEQKYCVAVCLANDYLGMHIAGMPRYDLTAIHTRAQLATLYHPSITYSFSIFNNSNEE